MLRWGIQRDQHHQDPNPVQGNRSINSWWTTSLLKTILFQVHPSRTERRDCLWTSDYQSEGVMEEEEVAAPSVEESSKPRRSAKRCAFVLLR